MIENYYEDLMKLGIKPDMLIPIEPELEDTFIQFMGK